MLLDQRNGFYAFESALHVFADGSVPDEIPLRDWNSPTLWRDRYSGLADGHFFFAEDVFGGQFSVVNDRVWTWDPETGETNVCANDVRDWADRILEDYDLLTGYSLAHDWQTTNGSLKRGERLIPSTPFIVGGEFAVENLRAVEAVSGMRTRGEVGLTERHPRRRSYSDQVRLTRAADPMPARASDALHFA